MKAPTKILSLGLAALLPTAAIAATLTIPAGTVVYGELGERVVSKLKETSEGDYVLSVVWRDVTVDGHTVVRAGTPMVVQVSKVKKAKLAGIEGKLELGAVSVRCLDGTNLLLDGGYDKSSRGNTASSISAAVGGGRPFGFIKGTHAVLEPGTIFDAVVQRDTNITVDDTSPDQVRPSRDLEVEVLYDEIDPEKDLASLPVRVRACRGQVSSAAVVTVNDIAIDRIHISPGTIVIVNDCAQTTGQIDLEDLAKHFTRGINRFEVEAGGTLAEVILDIEF